MQRISVLSVLTTALFLAAPTTAQAGEAASISELRAEARSALQSSEWQVAAANFKKVVELEPEDGTSWQLLGYCLHAMGKLDEALPIHKKAAEFPGVGGVAAYNVACVYALKGDNAAALNWLEQAVEKGFDRPEHIANDPDMDALRDDARFKKIMAAIEKQAGPDRVQVFVITTPRKSARVAWFGRSGSPGQIAIDFTPVKWQDKYDEMAGSDKLIGKKWRFGADFWTSLDNSVDLEVGDVKIPAGYYYLTLEQREPSKFVLAAHDAAKVKQQRIDAFQADQLRGGIEVPLAHATGDEVAAELDIAIKVKSGSQDHGKFIVRFGGHVLTAPVLMHVGKAKEKQ